MDAENGAVTIGWKAPTCTGGKKLTGFTIYVRAGPPETSEYVKFSTVDAAGWGCWGMVRYVPHHVLPCLE